MGELTTLSTREQMMKLTKQQYNEVISDPQAQKAYLNCHRIWSLETVKLIGSPSDLDIIDSFLGTNNVPKKSL